MLVEEKNGFSIILPLGRFVKIVDSQYAEVEDNFYQEKKKQKLSNLVKNYKLHQTEIKKPEPPLLTLIKDEPTLKIKEDKPIEKVKKKRINRMFQSDKFEAIWQKALKEVEKENHQLILKIKKDNPPPETKKINSKRIFKSKEFQRIWDEAKKKFKNEFQIEKADNLPIKRKTG